MRRALPVLLLSAAGFVVVWQFQPEASTTAPVLTAPPSGQVAAPAPDAGSSTVAVAGSAVTMRHGTVQVQVVFSGGAISDVQLLQAPTTQTSARALPLLRASALRAQSADIDTVTGATMTSDAYAESLQAAIDARPNR